jgi:hypothetical protein
MRNILFFFLLSICSFSAMAESINEMDIGTYVLLDRSLHPTDNLFRLSHSNGQWSLDVKNAETDWKGCGSQCSYRDSSEAEMQSYFPAGLYAKADFACIQNSIDGFCRYSSKTDPTRKGYFILAFDSGKASLMVVQRVKE